MIKIVHRAKRLRTTVVGFSKGLNHSIIMSAICTCCMFFSEQLVVLVLFTKWVCNAWQWWTHAESWWPMLLLLCPFNGLFSTTSWVSKPKKGEKPFWILMKQQETVDGSGISWTVCKSCASRTRQITTPSPNTHAKTGKAKTFTVSTMTKTVVITPKQLAGDEVVSYVQIFCGIYLTEFLLAQLC